MKLISFESDGRVKVGVIENELIYDLHSIDNSISDTMEEFLKGGSGQIELAKNAIKTSSPSISVNNIKLLSPVPSPTSVRDAYAFRQHVATARKNRGLDMIPEYDKFPVFYYGNHNAIAGPGEVLIQKDQSAKLDYELEIAAIIGRKGKNISVTEADDYIIGYTIMNDLSARDHSKRDDWPRWGVDWFGHKNFDGAAPLGPWITPADQLEDPYKCKIKLWVNDEEMQNEFVSDLIFDIAEQIEWITKRLTLLPGDVISTGTPSGVGRPRGIFLKPGDTVRINIDGIGELINPVVQGE